MEKKVINVLNYYEILLVDTEYPYFLLFRCNKIFCFCKRFTAITGHNKQMSVTLINYEYKNVNDVLLRNS